MKGTLRDERTPGTVPLENECEEGHKGETIET